MLADFQICISVPLRFINVLNFELLRYIVFMKSFAENHHYKKLNFGVLFKSICWNYSGTSLKRTLTGQKVLSALERCPPWRGLNWKVPKFKVRLFYTGLTLTRTPPPPYLTMGMWNGEKERCRRRNSNLHMFQLVWIWFFYSRIPRLSAYLDPCRRRDV